MPNLSSESSHVAKAANTTVLTVDDGWEDKDVTAATIFAVKAVAK